MSDESLSYATAGLISGCELFFKCDAMSQEEMDDLLTQKSLSLLEALHLCCLREIRFPASYFFTEEMMDAEYRLRNAIEQGELYFHTQANILHANHNDYHLNEDRNGCEFLIKIKDLQAIRIFVDTSCFIEWAINSGLPLPEGLLARIGVKSLTYSLDWIRVRKSCDSSKAKSAFSWVNLFARGEVQKLRKPDISRIQQEAAAQTLLFEAPNLTLEAAEKHPAVSIYIPGGKYSRDSRTFRDHVGYLFPTKRQGRPSRINSQLTITVNQSQEPIWDAFKVSGGENKCYRDLRVLKLICITIGKTLSASTQTFLQKKLMTISLLNYMYPGVTRSYEICMKLG